MLLRQYVSSSLSRYFTRPLVVGSAPLAPFQFPRPRFLPTPFASEMAYRQHLASIMQLPSSGLVGDPSQPSLPQWFTPSQLFSPLYAHAVSRYISSAVSRSPRPTSLRVVEFGGGSGQLAADVLASLAEEGGGGGGGDAVDVAWFAVEGSPSLAAEQRERLAQFYAWEKGRGKGDERRKFRIVPPANESPALRENVLELNLADVAQWGGQDSSDATALPQLPAFHQLLTTSSSPTLTVFLGLEILDNLPHDLVRCVRRPSAQPIEPSDAAFDATIYDYEQLCITRPSPSSSTGVRSFEPLSDAQILAYLRRASPSFHRSLASSSRGAYIPTVAFSVIQTLLSTLSSKSVTPPSAGVAFLLADFDSLPPPDLPPVPSSSWSSSPPPPQSPALNTPLVTDLSKIDYDADVLGVSEPFGECDILFPTDFPELCKLLDSSIGGSPEEGRHRATSFKSTTSAKQGRWLAEMLDEEDRKHFEATDFWRRVTGRKPFNPITDDFVNCQVLIHERRWES